MSEALTLHVDAIEELNREQAAMAENIKDRYAMANSDGFDTKALRLVIRRRAIEREALREQDSLVETYEAALGE